MKSAFLPSFLLALAFGPAAWAQSDDELRARELIARITKEMARIDELLLQVDPELGPKVFAVDLAKVERNRDHFGHSRTEGEVVDILYWQL